MTQHVLLTLLLLCVIAMKEPTAAQAPRDLIVNSPQGARHDPAKSDNTVKIKELVDRQVQAWEKHDFGIAAPDWLPSGELVAPGGRVPAEEMQAAMAGYFKQFRDLQVTVKNVFISTDGAKAAIEWDWDVTRRRDGTRAVTHDAISWRLRGNHGSIRGSWPMAISGYPRGHNVKWVTRCRAHKADLID